MLGFTKQEQGIVLFLIFSLLVGVSVQLYHRFFSETPAIEINQAFVDEFKAKSEQITSQPFQEKTLPFDQAELIRESDTVASKGIQINQQANGRSISEDKMAEFALVDINLANEKELQIIPRIGPVLARRIVRFRLENGRFARVEDLRQVKGIGKATLEKIAPYISIDSDGADSN